MKSVYSCPMHPEMRRDKPGICPECGMNLVKTDVEDVEGKEKVPGGDRHAGLTSPKSWTKAGHRTESFLKKFWVAAVLTVPIFAYSDIAVKVLGIHAPQFPGVHFVFLGIGSIVFFYGGLIFLTSAYRELKARAPGMMTLIAIAITTAYSYSVYAIFARTGRDLLFELSSLIAVMLLGHWMEMRAVSSAQGALKELSKLLPDTAEVVREGKTETIPLSRMRIGDMVFVRPGGRIPCDGVVAEGASEVNESMVTGESAPVEKQPGNATIAGTINGDGALHIKVIKIGEKTFLAGVMRLVEEAQASKSNIQLFSDKAAFLLTIVAVGSAALTFALWIFFHENLSFAFERTVSVLVIACPHALGLAVPLVAAISTTLAARHGFLVKRRIALEAARTIDTVLFDKTGTLTLGAYGVTDVWLGTAHTQKELLGIAAAVDANSEHVISKAIVQKAKELGAQIVQVRDFTRLPGKGVGATVAAPTLALRGRGSDPRGGVGGKRIFVGGETLVQARGATVSQALQTQIEEENAKGKTIIYVLAEKELLGVLALADIIREESRQAVRSLKEMGMRVAMVTGDSEGVASWVSSELGIDEYFARVLPHEKSEKVKFLQQGGKKVAFVGDGINDAPALVQADLGVAIGAGTNVAIESAGIILVKNDPRDIAKIIKLSRLTYVKMIQNLFWAAGYNIVALPLAAGALASRGILLQPALAALFMSASTVVVAINAMTMRRKSL